MFSGATKLPVSRPPVTPTFQSASGPKQIRAGWKAGVTTSGFLGREQLLNERSSLQAALWTRARWSQRDHHYPAETETRPVAPHFSGGSRGNRSWNSLCDGEWRRVQRCNEVSGKPPAGNADLPSRRVDGNGFAPVGTPALPSRGSRVTSNSAKHSRLSKRPTGPRPGGHGATATTWQRLICARSFPFRRLPFAARFT